MNVVRLLGKKSILSSLVVAGIVVVGIHYALTPQRVDVIVDPTWSPVVQQGMHNIIESVSPRIFGIENLKQKLSSEYPCLKDITITYASSFIARAYLKGWKPCVRIQSSVSGAKDYVICERNKVLEKELFSAETVAALPVITLVGGDYEEKRKEAECINVALNLHTSLFEEYRILWHSKTQICFECIDKPITIIADTHSVYDIERFAYVQRIYSSEEKYIHGMKADIRLKDSLVCAPLPKNTPS